MLQSISRSQDGVVTEVFLLILLFLWVGWFSSCLCVCVCERSFCEEKEATKTQKGTTGRRTGVWREEKKQRCFANLFFEQPNSTVAKKNPVEKKDTMCNVI